MSKSERVAWVVVVLLLIAGAFYAGMAAKPRKATDAGEAAAAAGAPSAGGPSFGALTLGYEAARRPGGEFSGSRNAFDAIVQFHPSFAGSYRSVRYDSEAPLDVRQLFNRAAKLDPIDDISRGARAGESSGALSGGGRFMPAGFGLLGALAPGGLGSAEAGSGSAAVPPLAEPPKQATGMVRPAGPSGGKATPHLPVTLALTDIEPCK